MARLAAEADGQDLEDKYVTSFYIIMREFGYTIQEMKSMYVTTYHMILEEMQKQAQKEKEQMRSHRRK